MNKQNKLWNLLDHLESIYGEESAELDDAWFDYHTACEIMDEAISKAEILIGNNKNPGNS